MKNPLELSDVSKCKLCVTLSKDHVPASGNPRAKVMIVGQSPGVIEVQQRKPFVGACGEMLDFMLDQAELQREEVYITNALKCRPPHNRPALDTEIANCRKQWLKGELAAVNPKLVLVLGKDAFMSLKLPEPFKHLTVCRSSIHDRRYLVSYHPSYFLRQGRMNEFIDVGNKLRRVLDESEQANQDSSESAQS